MKYYHSNTDEVIKESEEVSEEILEENPEEISDDISEEIFDLSDSEDKSPQARERIVEEDGLLAQIDAFRQNAMTLQNLINARQSKVFELEDELKEKQAQNRELEEELSNKQQALNTVLDDMKAELDNLAVRMDSSFFNSINEIKEPVMDKIHSENVRLYRNVYDFIKEDYDPKKFEEMVDKSAQKYSKTNRGPIVFTLIVSLINTGLLAYIVYMMMK